MGQECCLPKFILVFFNLIFLIVSLAILIIGIIVLVDADLILKALEKVGINMDDISAATGVDMVEIVKSFAIIIVVIGAVVSVVSFLGCCGACTGNHCLLGIYITFLAIILLAEVALVIVAAVLPHKFKSELKTQMTNILNDKFDADLTFPFEGGVKLSTKPEELAWASVQISLKCCGSSNYTDYQSIDWQKAYTLSNGAVVTAKVAASCCKLEAPIKIPDQINFVNLHGCLAGELDYLHEQGCVDGVYEYIDKYLYFVIGIAAGIAVIEILLIALAACSCRRSKKKRGDKYV